jgi:hypothetical protein
LAIIFLNSTSFILMLVNSEWYNFIPPSILQRLKSDYS